jgi:hypothetical protein
MAVKLVECLDWPSENRPGELLRITDQLAKAGVNLDALWAYASHTGEPKMAAIAKKPDKLRRALKGLGATTTRCFCATGKDKAGALVGMLRALAEANINVDCLDALAVGGNYAAIFWVSEADLPKAKRILKVR